jgi:hypothetical protein
VYSFNTQGDNQPENHPLLGVHLRADLQLHSAGAISNTPLLLSMVCRMTGSDELQLQFTSIDAVSFEVH